MAVSARVFRAIRPCGHGKTQVMSMRLCQERWKRFYPKDITVSLCPSYSEQTKLVEWVEDGSKGRS